MPPNSVPMVGDRRDRTWKTVRAGLTVVAVALLIAFVLLPFARNWTAREQQLKEAQAQVEKLATIVAQQPATTASASALEAKLSLAPTRVMRARSRTLAASALQSLVQELADASNVSVTRLDVTSADRGTGDLPISLSANGDIYGLTALLEKFRAGRQVVVLDKMSLQVNSALRGAPDVLQMTFSLHAPIIVE